MKVDTPTTNPGALLRKATGSEEQKEEIAMEFERIFAQRLVQEMTKGMFDSGDNQGVMSSGNEMYRRQIIDTLSGALAEQRKLGMADVVSKYLDNRMNAVSGETEHNND